MSDAALRVARVILEVTWRPEKNLEPPAEWRWQDFVNLSGDPLGPGESVRVVEDDDLAKVRAERDLAQAVRDGLTAQRDAARAECERLRETAQEEVLDNIRLRQQTHDLRTRVAELEAAAKTAALLAEVRESEWRVASDLAAEANAENAGGGAKQCSVSCQGIPRDGCNYLATCGTVCIKCGEIHRRPTVAQWLAVANAGAGNRLIGLSPAERDGLQGIADGVRRYAHGFIVTAISDAARAVDSVLARHSLDAPPEPRGWLTKNERTAVKSAHNYFAGTERDFLAAALRGLLARETPPRVKVPNRNVITTTAGARDIMWIDAIRAAGGEVEE